MTEEQNETQPQYVSQPRGQVRIAGLNPEAVDRRLAECSDFFARHCDEADYRNLDWYLGRMQLRFGVGDDIIDVVDDIFMAARCLHDRAAMHLELKPPEMFMSRRIMPVELGILSGMPMMTIEFSATYGLPLMMVIGKTAPDEIMQEVNQMTSYFRRDFCTDFVELTKLSAVVYAGALAAIGRGFDDEAMVALNLYGQARDSLRGMPPASLLPRLKRYDALNTALMCLCTQNFEVIGSLLAPEAEAFAAAQVRAAGDDYLEPSKMPPPKYFDLSILAILALIVLRGQAIVLPETGAIAAYRDFVRGLTEAPEHRLEVPGLDEETRRILEQAGIDPENLGVDNSFQDEKAASEARAAEIFEEKQRLAQQAVREKLRQTSSDDDEAPEAKTQNLPRSERLKLHDDDVVEEQEQRRSYSDFFSGDDRDDEAARKANEEDGDEHGDESSPKKDYAAFFEGQDNLPGAVAEDDEDVSVGAKDFSGFFAAGAEEDEAIRDKLEREMAPVHDDEKPSKDFSSFFSHDDEDDSAIRAHVEEESAEAADAGRNYAAFFDQSDDRERPAFDDGSNDVTETRSFSADFFSSETKSALGLKMTADEPEEPVKVEEKPAPVEARPIEREEVEDDDSPRRDFSRFFDEETAPVSGLKMTADDDDKPVKVEEKPAPVETRPIEREEVEGDDKPSRDFSRFFDEAPSDDAAGSDTSEEAVAQEKPERSFSDFFTHDGEEVQETDDHEAQLRELEEEQARKAAIAAAKQPLKLALDGTEEVAQNAPESYQARMARLIAEKQAAARAQALREREEAERELEELRQNGVAKPVVEQLKLRPDESSDPDEIVEKKAPEDLVIKGFAYDDLDRIHSNTAVREDVEEDFDLYAAMADKNRQDS